MSKIIDEIRKELISAEVKAEDKISFLSGAIRGAGELSFTMKGFALTLCHTDKDFVEKLCRIVCDISGENFIVEQTFKDIKITKGIFYYISIPSEYAVDILEKCEIVRNCCELVDTLPKTIIGKKSAKKAYLAGLFLSCGYLGLPEEISDWRGGKTRSGYLMEFKLNSDIVMDSITKLIVKVAILDKKYVLTRKKATIVYVKNAEAISKVLACIGSNYGVLALQEIVTARQMKNDINRANNFDLANIDKSLSASEKQIEDIEFIDKTIGIDSLSPALIETCRMRLSYPTLGLEELGELFDPPISKSCINHRMRKLSAIASDLQ